jgi:hypothetical protein
VSFRSPLDFKGLAVIAVAPGELGTVFALSAAQFSTQVQRREGDCVIGRVASGMGKGLHWAETLLPITASVALGVLLRPILVAVASAGLATAFFLAISSQRFCAWFWAFCRHPVHYVRHQGFRLAEDILMHPCFGWARILHNRINDCNWHTLTQDFCDTPSVMNRPVDSALPAPL